MFPFVLQFRGRDVKRLLSFVFALALACVLSACTSTEVADSTPVEEYDKQAIVEAGESAFAGIQPSTEFEKHLLKSFSYKIGDATINGNEATLNVRVSNVDLGKAIDAAYKDLGKDENIESIGQIYRTDEASNIESAIMDVIYDHIDNSKDKVSKNLELHLSKKDNEWTLDADSAKECADAIYAGLDSSKENEKDTA